MLVPYRINARSADAPDPAVARFGADSRSRRRRAGLVGAAVMALATAFVAAPLGARHEVRAEPTPVVYRMKLVLKVPGHCVPSEPCDF